jgi:hypothetical protein
MIAITNVISVWILESGTSKVTDLFSAYIYSNLWEQLSLFACLFA